MSLEQKLLVFPTSRSIREFINAQDSNGLLPTISTIDELFSKAIRVKGLNYIDEDQRFLYLKEAIKIKNYEKLGLSDSLENYPMKWWM